jgi:hypothetical protein
LAVSRLNGNGARTCACGRFFAWCEHRGLTLPAIRPFDVAAWVKELREEHSTPGVKQQLAAVRMLFDWLITAQVPPTNPAASVRGPKYVVVTGKTPVLFYELNANASKAETNAAKKRLVHDLKEAIRACAAALPVNKVEVLPPPPYVPISPQEGLARFRLKDKRSGRPIPSRSRSQAMT